MSDVEQAEEQSMEDILSSIRKIISDDPQADSGAEGTTGPLAQNGHATAATPLTGNLATTVPGAFPGRLSDALGRISPAEETNSNSFTSGDDDLSDLLEDPLHTPTTSESSTTFPGGLGVTDTSVDSPAEPDPEQNNNDAGFGSFIPIRNTAKEPDPEPVVIATSKSSAEAALKKARSSDEADGADTDISSVDLGVSVAPDTQVSSGISQNTDDLPRSMSALSSGIAMPANISSAAGSSPGSNVSTTFQASILSPRVDALAAKLSENNLQPSVENNSSVLNVVEQISLAEPEPASSEPTPGMSAPAVSVAVSPISASDVHASSAPQATASLSPNLSSGQKSLEDTVSDMIRPMLYAWLEANLPRIVENALRIEMQERTGTDKIDPSNP